MGIFELGLDRGFRGEALTPKHAGDLFRVIFKF